MNKIKTEVTSFLFCQKNKQKNILKKCRKSIDKEKKV